MSIPFLGEQVPGKFLLQTRLGRFAFAAVAWTLLGCLFALPDLSSGAGWRYSLLLSLTLWWSWGLLTPVIRSVDRRINVPNKQLTRRILAHILPSLLVTALYAHLLAVVRAGAGIGDRHRLVSIGSLADVIGEMFFWNWLVYWLIVGAWQAYFYHQHYIASELRSERLEKSFYDAHLHALRLQLDPHFLFNALNTISSQLEREPKLARRMIEHLGDLLRMSLESKDRQEVTLVEELAFLEHYLAIQKIRFGDHLCIEIRIAPDVKYAQIPCLFVQPLVENAIRHGISKRASGGTVIVSATRDADRLELRILDDGVGLPAGWTLENSDGVGLSVTRQRLAGLYPEEASFAVSRRSSGGTEVRITLPLREVGEEVDVAVLV